MEIKPGDVFRFAWSDEERAKRFMPDHCFDGQLLAVDHAVRGLVLVDSYWGWPHDRSLPDGKTWFAPAEAEKRGTLTFLFNMADVEPAREWEPEYFAPEDIFDVSEQHRCRKRLFKRIGAQRSQARMRETLNAKIEKAQHDAEWAARTVERLRGTLAEAEAGNCDVWF